jgi:hypothetical protein
MNNINFEPLASSNELFGIMYLFFNSSGENDIDQIQRAFRATFNSNLDEKQLSCAIQTFMFTWNIDKTETKQIFAKLNQQLKAFKKHIFPPVTVCPQCRLILSTNTAKHPIITYFETSCEECFIYTRECKNCKIIYGIDKFKKDGVFYFYPRSVQTEFAQTSSETMFHRALIKAFDEYLFRNAVSFSGIND